MSRLLILIPLLLVGCLSHLQAAVKVGALSLTPPDTWKKEQPSSRMRLAQFAIPGGDGSTQLAIFSFPGGGGSVDANLKRWIGQFEEAGRKESIVTGESTNGSYHLLELSGTFKKPDGPPMAGKTIPAPNSRGLNAIVTASDGRVYFLKMVGPDAVVSAQAKAFRSAFGADAAKEKPYKLAP